MGADEQISDEELLRRFLDGDEHGFEELVRRHEDHVFAIALRMTGDRSDALDATQEAFIAAFRRGRSFRGESAFGTWLYRITVNASLDLMRKRRRHETPDEAGEVPAHGPAVDESVALRMDVSSALARLPADYREAVVLHDLGGVPYEEIARITGANLGTVKSRISRGRRRLAQLLELPGPAAASKEQP